MVIQTKPLVHISENVYKKAQEFVKKNKVYYPNVSYLIDIAILNFINNYDGRVK